MIDDEFFGPAIPRSPRQPGTAYGGKRVNQQQIRNSNRHEINSGDGGNPVSPRTRNNDTVQSEYQPIHLSVVQFKDPTEFRKPVSPNSSTTHDQANF